MSQWQPRTFSTNPCLLFQQEAIVSKVFSLQNTNLRKWFMYQQYPMVTKVFFWCFSSIHTHILTVLPANWLMRHGLATKHIYAYIRNTSDEGRGFAGRAYEGQRVMILSGEREDAIQVVHIRYGHGIILARYLLDADIKGTGRGCHQW
jgi:hypothetical protein